MKMMIKMILAEVYRKAWVIQVNSTLFDSIISSASMAPKTKKAKTAVKAMSKARIAEAIAKECEVKKHVAGKMLDTLSNVATAEMKKTGQFSLPGFASVKVRTKPGTKAGSREVFGKVVDVKAKPARRIVKAFPSRRLIAAFDKDEKAAPSAGEGATFIDPPSPVEGATFIDVEDSIDAGFSADWDVHQLWNFRK